MQAVFLGCVEYDLATLIQEQFFYGKLRAVKENVSEPEDTLIFLEHPPVYTWGNRVKQPKDFFRDWQWVRSRIRAHGVRLTPSTRGGLITFHGPGQLVCYPIMSIGGMSRREYLCKLEGVVIGLLAELNLSSRAEESGIWVRDSAGRERKICSFGVRFGLFPDKGDRVAMHGFALNVTTDSAFFGAIYPCGISRENPVTINLKELIPDPPSLVQLAEISSRHFAALFGREIEWITPEAIGFYPRRKPHWLRVSPRMTERVASILKLTRENQLITVCEEARCPNIQECWSAGDVTFMIMGEKCTRACGFCNVKTGKYPGPVDSLEPLRVAAAVSHMPQSHIVITSVNRDDLADGGAQIWAATIREIRRQSSQKTVEVLTPDFMGKEESVKTVLAAEPDVFGHNLETVRRLHQRVRRIHDGYERSLRVLATASAWPKRPLVKSNIMLGHGESEAEVMEMMRDLKAAGTDILTITQYLRPSSKHLSVVRYYLLKDFERLKTFAEKKGFSAVVSGPLVRTSYHAGEAYRKAMSMF